MYVVPDEIVLWNYIDMNTKIKIVGRNPRITGSELKYLSGTVTNIITNI